MDTRLISSFASDPDLAEVAVIFLQDLKLTLEKLKSAREGGDFKQLATIAHYLKGGSYSSGFEYFGDLCKKLELAAKAQNRQAIEPVYDEIILLAGQLKVK
jgi:HPt (histidine-containing phosphotransfer) domain-containing protein